MHAGFFCNALHANKIHALQILVHFMLLPLVIYYMYNVTLTSPDYWSPILKSSNYKKEWKSQNKEKFVVLLVVV